MKGSGHCGAVRFTVEGEADHAIECNCMHCSRKEFLLRFTPRESFVVTAGEDRLSTYRVNRHVIEHLFCGTRGCQPFGLGTGPDGKAMAAINLRCVDGLDLASVRGFHTTADRSNDGTPVPLIGEQTSSNGC